MAEIKAADIGKVLEMLAAPTPPEEIKQRDLKTKAGKVIGQLDYVDARFVMDRLDSAVGAENWQKQLARTDDGIGFICRLGIKLAGEWVWKDDAAGDTDIEAYKGGASDAFKRAGVNWGIARDLYSRERSPVELAQEVFGDEIAETPAPTPRTRSSSSTPESKCPVHKVAWKWVPPGFSKKTNKKYAGFYTCPDFDCDQRPDHEWAVDNQPD